MLRFLALFCPPLAVAATGKFRELPVNCGLTLALFLPGVLHSLSVVNRFETERRNSALLSAMSGYYA